MSFKKFDNVSILKIVATIYHDKYLSPLPYTNYEQTVQLLCRWHSQILFGILLFKAMHRGPNSLQIMH